MKTVQGLCLLLFCTFAVLSSRAQLTVFAGPQITSASYSIRNAPQSTESKTGFMAGVGLKNLIEGPAYFAPLLYYSQKGYKVSFDRPGFPPDSGAKNNDTKIHAVEFAPLVQFNFSKKASYAFLRFGPAFDFAISGREAFDSLNNKRIEQSMLFDFGGYSYVTISGVVHLGYQHKSGLTVFAHYDHGLTSLNNADYGPYILHRIGGLSVGWKLGRKR